MVLATLDGRQILNTRRPFGQADLPRTVYTYEEVRRAPRQTLLSDIYFAPLGQAYSFAVTVPVERDGKAAYLVSYAGYASAMQKVFDDQQLQASWVASVVDSKGTVYTLDAFKIKAGEKRQVEVPAYVKDIAKVQVYCAWAEVLLGDASFSSPVK